MTGSKRSEIHRVQSGARRTDLPAKAVAVFMLEVHTAQSTIFVRYSRMLSRWVGLPKGPYVITVG
jgi:hypothetical protein|eukprot:COSAG01_NODE_638_length_14605_cov_46.266097_12_plen_65_part_00